MTQEFSIRKVSEKLVKEYFVRLAIDGVNYNSSALPENNQLKDTPFDFVYNTRISRIGVVRNKSEIIIEPIYSSIVFVRSHKIFIAINFLQVTGSNYYFDFNGNLLLEDKFTGPFDPSQIPKIFVDDFGNAVAVKLWEENPASDKSSVLGIFRHVKGISPELYFVQEDKLYGVIDYKNNIILSTVYNKIIARANCESFIVKKGDQYFTATKEDNLVKELKYSHILYGDDELNF